MHISIPPDISFAELQIQRLPTGNVQFNTPVLAAICDASGTSLDVLQDAGEDAVADLIIQWYAAHRAAGGAPDAGMDDLIAETRAEDAHGQGFSHRAGSA